MQTQVFLWVLAAAILSLVLALFQYLYKNQKRKKYHLLLAALRFLSIFCGLLLLINPKFIYNELSVEKAKLLLLVDNSLSMLRNSPSDSLVSKINKIQSNSRVIDRFDISTYSFGNNFSNADSIEFDDSGTNISEALQKSSELFSSSNASVVLFTDGNQTSGRDYEYVGLPSVHQVWPLIVGDTTEYRDLAVSQINLNKYAFLGNQFPVESVITYQGNSSLSTQFRIFFDGREVYREQLQFSKNEKSKTLSSLLSADQVGVKSVRVAIGSFDGERNVLNNSKDTAIEVIDEKTKILFVSEIAHPDIGALKKAIESNEQREVEIVDSQIDVSNHENSDVVILYQPTTKFRDIFDFATTRNIPLITVVGNHTDLQWVNSSFKALDIEQGYPVQDVFGRINNSFPHFNISELDYEGYPPVSSKIGPILFTTTHDPIIDMIIKGVEMENPLMTVVSEGDMKQVFLFGENIWKWRLQNYRNTGSFDEFDNLFGKLLVYLSSSGKRNRLEVEYEKVYDGSQELKITANFYDKTFAPKSEADLSIELKGIDNSFTRTTPMLFKSGYFEVDLGDLEYGEYKFTIKENSENISRTGSFKILDYNPEDQFYSSNYKKLERLANKTNGKVYFENQVDGLIAKLVDSDQFVPIQKNNQKTVPLIDFQWLLLAMVLALAAEWIIRKYNGLL